MEELGHKECSMAWAAIRACSCWRSIGKEGNASDNKYNHTGEEALGSTCMDSNASGGPVIVSGGVALTRI
jgi:hypothetical protein